MKKFVFFIGSLYKSISRLMLKIRGKSPKDIVEQKVVSGKAWDEFCDSLKTAGAALKYPGTPQDAFNQAEGIRYLARLTRAALETYLEHGDTQFPTFNRVVHETVKMGADNPDNLYLNATIDGQYNYQITGQRNSVYHISFYSQKGGYGSSGSLEPTGDLSGQDLIVDENGIFKITVSKNQPNTGNWLPIEAASNLLIVRQTFLDKDEEVPAIVQLKCLDNTQTKKAPFSPEKLVEGLNAASLFVGGAPILFNRWVQGFKKHANELPQFDPEVSNAMGGVRNIIYYHSYWKLQEGEALLIHATPPECEYWNFQVNNYWMESLDYQFHTIHLNKKNAQYNGDGSVDIILSHKNPGHPNWLSTQSRLEGTMCFRWMNAQKHPQPQTKVVPIDEIDQHLQQI